MEENTDLNQIRLGKAEIIACLATGAVYLLFKL